jgi:hypothetical protein
MANERKRQSAQIDRGTDETRRKRRYSTIERMINNKTLGGFELRAAQEIETIFTGLTNKSRVKTQLYDEWLGGSFDDEWDSWLIDAYNATYKKWAVLKDHMYHRVCIEILCVGSTARDLDRSFKCKNGRSAKVLIEGLRVYAIMRGWPDRATLADWRLENPMIS